MSSIPSAASARGRLTHGPWRAAAPSDAGDPAEAASPGPPTPPPLRALSPVETTAALLRGRFTALVVWHLFWGGKRFYQLVHELRGVPPKAIAHELEGLERAGIVHRALSRGPMKVEYKLTPQGESLKIVVAAMYEWGLAARRVAKSAPGEPPGSFGSA